jgi:hypothetical protein
MRPRASWIPRTTKPRGRSARSRAFSVRGSDRRPRLHSPSSG